jgi:hypothetical protein
MPTQIGTARSATMMGFFAYHAVPTNFAALRAFHHHVTVSRLCTLQRRSQKDRTTWQRIAKIELIGFLFFYAGLALATRPLRLIRGFKPKLKKAAERLERLRTPEGEPIPPNTLSELHRDMERRRLVRDQIRQIESARRDRLEHAPGEGAHAMVAQNFSSTLWGPSRVK